MRCQSQPGAASVKRDPKKSPSPEPTWADFSVTGAEHPKLGPAMPQLRLAALVFALLLVGAPFASAQTCTTSWTAAAGGSWSTPGNWSAGVPTASSTACITLDGTYTVTGPTTTIAINALVLGGSSGIQAFSTGRTDTSGRGRSPMWA